MTEPADRLAALAGADLVAGARLRTERALASAARNRPEPDRPRLGIRPAAAALAATVLVVVGALVAWRTWPDDREQVLVSVAEATASAPPGEAVVVHVVGEVHRPGLVRLPPGARVADALDAAGGATEGADLAAVNLARVLADGEQVVVPAPGTTATGPPGIDLNTADAAALDALPGIGPVLAARIVAWRETNGRFSTVDELAEVAGIGPALLAGIKDQVRV